MGKVKVWSLYRDKLHRTSARYWYFWHDCFGQRESSYKYDTWEECYYRAHRHAVLCQLPRTSWHIEGEKHGTQG